jgi:hypothetical protein
MMDTFAEMFTMDRFAEMFTMNNANSNCDPLHLNFINNQG